MAVQKALLFTNKSLSLALGGELGKYQLAYQTYGQLNSG